MSEGNVAAGRTASALWQRASVHHVLAMGIASLVLASAWADEPTVRRDRQVDGTIANQRVAKRAAAPRSRSFEFIYAGKIDKLAPGKMAQVWLPVAQSGPLQKVEIVQWNLPAPFQLTRDKKYGNLIAHFAAAADANGQVPFRIRYRVTRQEANAGNREHVPAEQRELFLAAARLIPKDERLKRRLLGNQAPQDTDLSLARSLYEAVDAHMKYDKPAGKPWGRGDAVWACDAGFGNCTDFHSLFISIARNLGIPARFEIGFPLAPNQKEGTVGGYHCWAMFESNGQWVPVDISEADKNPDMKEYYFGNLTPDRVAFTVGRDLQLLPPPANGPVNFLVYPYVEVDAQPYATLIKEFGYHDLP